MKWIDLFSGTSIEIWIYRAVIVVIAGSLWWETSQVDALQETITAKEKALVDARLEYEKEFNEKLVQATSDLQHELNRANDIARTRGADVERLRLANAKLQARAKAIPSNVDREALARCSELLTESAGLVTEGEGLLLKHGAEHDALIELTGSKK